MVLTRHQEAAQQALFTALVEGDAGRAAEAVRSLGTAACSLGAAAGATALHWAAALDCADALQALVAAGLPLEEPLGRPARHTWAPWLWQLWGRLSVEQSVALGLPGCTALAVACKLGHLRSVRALLELGAHPGGVGEPQEGSPKPYTPLSAAVLSAGPAPAVRAVVAALLAAGGDPLAPSVRRRCSVLRCACGSEFLPNGALPLLLDHLERQGRAGRLAFHSGDAAADVMIAAARCCRVGLFRLAHEYALAASGRRRAAEAEAEASRRACAAARRRAIESESEDEAEGGGGGGSPDSSAYSDADGEGGSQSAALAWLSRLLRRGSDAAATWQPSELQLFEVTRSAALGGCPPILRCILASALPFNLRHTDASGNGLLAHCAAHAEVATAAESLALLHGAGARLSLKRLLYVLEKRPCGAVVAALLAHERPAVTTDDATIKAASVVSFSCPIHRLLHAWNRGSHAQAAADPAGWRREVTKVLEALLAAGYRPTVYSELRRPLHVVGSDGNMAPAPLPFDPFDVLPIRNADDRLLVHVARQGGWDTDVHRIWPPAFKQAVRTLLLAAHRLAWQAGQRGRPGRAERAARRASGGAQPTTLAALPLDVLLQIAERAAFPVSAWL